MLTPDLSEPATWAGARGPFSPGCAAIYPASVVVAVLGIEVSESLLELWAKWLAPDRQPFFVGPDHVLLESYSYGDSITPELRDTYRLWGVPKDSRPLWLCEEEFSALAKRTRGALVREQVKRRRGAVPTVRAWGGVLDARQLRAQSDGHRFVWWPTLVAADPVGILTRVISTKRLPSQHTDVKESTWRQCETVLPAVRDLAGTFPTGSHANCFTTVMAAAGADSDAAYDSLDPFIDWLTTRCRPRGEDRRPGTVLVWRDRESRPVHAAVTIGDGWALEKPSQEWHSPRTVAAVGDVIRTARLAGQRLERHTILS